MPWCPNCKMEYRKGLTVCSDCNIELVEELPMENEFVPFFQAEVKEVADKLVRYFEYSGLISVTQFDEENEVFVVSVPADKEKKAKKLYQAFYFVEREHLEQSGTQSASTPGTEIEDNMGADPSSSLGIEADDADVSQNALQESTSDEIQPENTGENNDSIEDLEDKSNQGPATYVMKADQYKDLTSTVFLFLLFGIAGLIVVLLNAVEILTFINGILPTLVLGALFLFFIYVGLSSNKKAKQVKSEIAAENKLTGDINNWLRENITKDYLSSIRNENISEELNYIKVTENIKNSLYLEFGEQNSAYLDRLIEEFYSSNFDNE